MIVAINGIISTTLVLLMENLGEIIPLTISVTGMTAGPLMGIFTLGMLFPKANAKVITKSLLFC
jgi:sodium-coupled monocarboxylate transporter 8/12